jgi:hypothetical protein
MDSMTICHCSCPKNETSHFLSGVDFDLRYAPGKGVTGWSVRNFDIPRFAHNRPIRFEYVCPYCAFKLESCMLEGMKGCICPDCGRKSEFTVTTESPYGYFYGVDFNDGKELLGDDYFEWASSLSR